jgi:membrane-bound serine protease (ClpP class)
MRAGTRLVSRRPLRGVRRRRVATGLFAFVTAAVLVGGPAFASATDAPLGARGAAPLAMSPQPIVDVVQVSGWLDPVMVDFLAGAIRKAAADDVEAVVVQLDSPGALVDRPTFDALLRTVRESAVPIAVWVGPTGSRALREAGELVEAAALAGAAPRARVEIGGRRLSSAEALDDGVTQLNEQESAVLGTFIAALDGHQAAGRALTTATFAPSESGPPEATLTVQTRLAKLELVPRFLHTAASPPIAYLMLLAGLALVVFELFTAGSGLAAVVAIGALVLAGYGLDVLPTNPWGLVLIALGTFGFAVDVQTGVPRVWTGIGLVSLVAGSMVLFHDPVTLGWLPLAGGVLGIVLMMLAGLPATVRSRFSTPTIGRESMVGEPGEVVAELRPQGVVRVREALWPARTNRSTPLAVGDRVRVVGVVGAQLEVAPEMAVTGAPAADG